MKPSQALIAALLSLEMTRVSQPSRGYGRPAPTKDELDHKSKRKARKKQAKRSRKRNRK